MSNYEMPHGNILEDKTIEKEKTINTEISSGINKEEIDVQERRNQLAEDSKKDEQESAQKAQEILKKINEGGKGHTEGREQRELNKNDLIILEGDDIEKAQSLLEKNGIPFEVQEYTKRSKADESGGYVPGEFILSIMDSQKKEKPASPELIIATFEFLKDSGVIVRYGKTPNKGV